METIGLSWSDASYMPSPTQGTGDLATITPYIQHAIRRIGYLVLDLSPLEETLVTRLDLEPRVLFKPHMSGRDHS